MKTVGPLVATGAMIDWLTLFCYTGSSYILIISAITSKEEKWAWQTAQMEQEQSSVGDVRYEVDTR